jgi:hypothetical protein
MAPNKSKINLRTKKKKTSRHFEKCTLKKFLLYSKEKNKLANLDNWSYIFSILLTFVSTKLVSNSLHELTEIS